MLLLKFFWFLIIVFAHTACVLSLFAVAGANSKRQRMTDKPREAGRTKGKLQKKNVKKHEGTHVTERLNMSDFLKWISVETGRNQTKSQHVPCIHLCSLVLRQPNYEDKLVLNTASHRTDPVDGKAFLKWMEGAFLKIHLVSGVHDGAFLLVNSSKLL